MIAPGVQVFGGEMTAAGDIIADRFRVLRALGQGGMGTTWEAEALDTGQRVALKALSLKAMSDWKSLDLFEREARVLAGLSHPSIPRFIDAIKLDEGDLFLVQELVEGRSLAERLKDGHRSTEVEVRQIARALLETLIYLHGLSPPVIHRDIKPQNVLVRDSGEIALVDFGAVKEGARREGSFASTVVGTYGYMAPEQFQGKAEPSSDLYALGATLVFLLTGRDPSDLPQRRLKIDFRADAGVSERMAGWLDRLLEPAPEDRIPTARAALDALDDLDRPLPDPAPRTLTRSRGAHAAHRPWGSPASDDPPSGSRLEVSREGGTLTIKVPRLRVSQWSPALLFQIVFTTFWLGFVAVWTAAALLTIVMALFSIPFWLVGFFMFWRLANQLVGSQTLTIGPEEIHLEYKLLGQTYRRLKGRTADFQDASFLPPRQGRRDQRPGATRLEVGIKHYDIGAHLSDAENRWLAQHISDHVQSTRLQIAGGDRSTLPAWGSADSGQEARAQIVEASRRGR